MFFHEFNKSVGLSGKILTRIEYKVPQALQIWNQRKKTKQRQPNKQSRNHREWNVGDMKNKIENQKNKKRYGEKHSNQTWNTSSSALRSLTVISNPLPKSLSLLKKSPPVLWMSRSKKSSPLLVISFSSTFYLLLFLSSTASHYRLHYCFTQQAWQLWPPAWPILTCSFHQSGFFQQKRGPPLTYPRCRQLLQVARYYPSHVIKNPLKTN